MKVYFKNLNKVSELDWYYRANASVIVQTKESDKIKTYEVHYDNDESAEILFNSITRILSEGHPIIELNSDFRQLPDEDTIYDIVERSYSKDKAMIRIQQIINSALSDLDKVNENGIQYGINYIGMPDNLYIGDAIKKLEESVKRLKEI